ncbi:MAG TPA: DUF3515 domain-containing protein, partial [Micromonosporaceae bacterium]
MVDQISPHREQQSGVDRTARHAALWATAVALPVALVVGVLAVLHLRPGAPAPAPTPSHAPRAQSTAPVS